MDPIQVLNQAPVKSIFVAHFMLSSWALIGNWLPSAYLYYNAVLLLTLLWSMHAHDNSEPILMSLVINLLSIILDAICIGSYYDTYRNIAIAFGFSCFIAIANLLLRPISSLLLLRVYNERCGRYSSFGFPGLDIINTTERLNPSTGRTGRAAYEDIDTNVHQSVPSPLHDIESNTPYGQKPLD